MCPFVSIFSIQVVIDYTQLKIRTKNNRNYYKNIFVPTDSNCDENFEDDKNVNRIVEMERAIEEPSILPQLNTGAQILTSNISTDKHQTDLDGSG